MAEGFDRFEAGARDLQPLQGLPLRCRYLRRGRQHVGERPSRL